MRLDPEAREKGKKTQASELHAGRQECFRSEFARATRSNPACAIKTRQSDKANCIAAKKRTHGKYPFDPITSRIDAQRLTVGMIRATAIAPAIGNATNLKLWGRSDVAIAPGAADARTNKPDCTPSPPHSGDG